MNVERMHGEGHVEVRISMLLLMDGLIATGQ